MTANILLPGRQRFGEKERKRERERRVEGPGCTAVVGARFVRTLPERGHHRGDAARTHNNGTGNDYKTHTRHTKWTEITTTDQQSTPCSPRPPPLPFLSRSSSLFRWAPTTVALSRPAAARLLFFFLRCFFPRVSGFFFSTLVPALDVFLLMTTRIYAGFTRALIVLFVVVVVGSFPRCEYLFGAFGQYRYSVPPRISVFIPAGRWAPRYVHRFRYGCSARYYRRPRPCYARLVSVGEPSVFSSESSWAPTC